MTNQHFIDQKRDYAHEGRVDAQMNLQTNGYLEFATMEDIKGGTEGIEKPFLEAYLNGYNSVVNANQ